MQPNNPPENELASNELELSEGERAALDAGKEEAAVAAATDDAAAGKTAEELQAEADAAKAQADADAAAAAAKEQPASAAPAPTPFVPQYQVENRDFDAELADVQAKLLALKTEYKAGNIDDDAYEAQFEALQDTRSTLRVEQSSAKLTAELNQQNQDQQWAYLNKQFLSLPENAQIGANPILFSAWETAMQVVVNEAAKAGTQLTDWDLMAQARQKLVEGGMLGSAAARAAPDAAPAAPVVPVVPEKPDRRAPLKDVPATLSTTPAAADALARPAAEHLADEDSIEDLEEKLASMSESARDRVLSQVPGGFVDD